MEVYYCTLYAQQDWGLFDIVQLDRKKKPGTSSGSLSSMYF